MADPKALQLSSDKILNEGPVLAVFNKRLRALRKKLNRISQMEESLSKGKSLNKEQKETLRSKSSVITTINELEKILHPVSEAVDLEIQLALDKFKQTAKSLAEERENELQSAISDLLGLLYLGSLFDMHTLMRASECMLIRAHERNCCLTYDCVTDDDGASDELLKEWDFDLIAMMAGLLTSRPVTSRLPHKISFQRCVEHAKLWLENSEKQIEPDSGITCDWYTCELNLAVDVDDQITYADLRRKLNKIMRSDYFTKNPVMKAPIEMIQAAGNYPFQFLVHKPVIPEVFVNGPMESSSAEFEQEVTWQGRWF
ncbi:glycine-rich protein [Striga asiatica]|uniref:Glycine-rich protein n=1 Tax=Striga asiatica TaxID=4170 RepID=A0A5A7PI39_STRAF|nr:glycine-rich protein [Striga asiatica]